jgi:hypothetical protein
VSVASSAGQIPRREPAPLDAPARGGIAAILFGGICLAILAWGWTLRGQGLLRPDGDLGYRLGVVGASSMLLLLGYSARKRIRGLARLGPLRHWFRVHMLLGVLGPAAILLHCNFSLGSLNANVALFSMLLVAGSGVGGRFIYTRVHVGLYGRRRDLAELRLRLVEERERPVLKDHPGVVQTLRAFEERTTAASRGLPRRIVSFWIGEGVTRRRCLALLRRDQREARRAVASYLGAIRRTVRLAVWERLFRTWHAVHLPLCVMLVLTAGAHVVAVHLY